MGGLIGSNSVELKRASYADVDPFESEQRFLLTRAQVVDFMAAVGPRAALELYDRARPLSFTRTTYFDTDDFAYLRSCASPIARRLRLREYAVATTLGEPPVLSGICFLELKQHAGTARSKVRLSAPSQVLERIIRRDGDLNAVSSGLDQLSALEAIQKELTGDSVAPRLTTWYRRTCMTAESGRVRITLDDGLTFCRPQPLGKPGDSVGPTDVVGHGPPQILEVKYWDEKPDWLVQATSDLTPAIEFSKFRTGMAAIDRERQRLGLYVSSQSANPGHTPGRSTTNRPLARALTPASLTAGRNA